MAHCSATNDPDCPVSGSSTPTASVAPPIGAPPPQPFPARTGSAPPSTAPAIPAAASSAPRALLCTYHQLHVEPVTPSLSFNDGPHPVDHLSPGEREALSAAATLPEPDSEIAILRILIRHAASRGDAEAARLGMETLTHLLKARHDLQQHPVDPSRPSGIKPSTTSPSCSTACARSTSPIRHPRVGRIRPR